MASILTLTSAAVIDPDNTDDRGVSKPGLRASSGTHAGQVRTDLALLEVGQPGQVGFAQRQRQLAEILAAFRQDVEGAPHHRAGARAGR